MNGFTWWMIMIWELLDCDCSQREREHTITIYRHLYYSYLLCSSASEGECLSGKNLLWWRIWIVYFQGRNINQNQATHPSIPFTVSLSWVSDWACAVLYDYTWIHLKMNAETRLLYHGLHSFSNFRSCFYKTCIPLFPTNFAWIQNSLGGCE